MMALLLCLLVFTSVIQNGLLKSVSKARDADDRVRASEYVDMNRFRSELLYPHDREYRIDLNRGQAVKNIPLIFRIQFFGFRYPYIFVHRDGHVLFNKGLLEYPSPVRFPVLNIKDPAREEDPSLIAPWLGHQDIPNEIEGAGVYFQMVDLFREKNDSLRERMKLDFKDAMIGSQHFDPIYAVIVTWKNMTHANRMPGRKLRTNTYQAVIATDERRTYVMFNYDAINWISDKDNYDGQKGIPPFIGFNAGNQTRAFEFEPYSQQPRVSRLPSLGFGNGLRGRFYFQVDEEIWPGCCIEKSLDVNWQARPKLTFFPRYGSILGGTTVNVTGPCFESPSSVIRCKFDYAEVNGIYRSPNYASCTSPPLKKHGYVDLSVSIDNGPYLFYGKYYVQPQNMNVSLYKPPSVASAIGKSKFLTFDGTNYTFNGKGEFVLTRVHDGLKGQIDVQGRLEQPEQRFSWMPKINRTRLMAVVAKENKSSTVEFRVRPTVARWRYHMYVIVDNEYVYFWDHNVRVQRFRNVTVYQPSYIHNMSHIVAKFDSGAAVEVMEINGQMNVHVHLPKMYMNRTRGLLGKWSGVKDDDFTSPDGTVWVIPGDSSRLIHYDFGMKYRLREVADERVGRSLFFHDSKPFTFYDDKDFIPEFNSSSKA